jgi:hypothetical protein
MRPAQQKKKFFIEQKLDKRAFGLYFSCSGVKQHCCLGSSFIQRIDFSCLAKHKEVMAVDCD